MRVAFVPIVTATLTLIQVGQVSAGTKCVAIIGCGKVKNESPWEMRVTKVEDDSYPKAARHPSSTPNLCAFSNWGASFLFGGGHKQTVWCKQITLSPNNHEGGRNNHDDVDGLTFPYEDWHMYGDKKTKGVWVKIHDGDHIVCSKSNGKPQCGQGDF